MKKYIAFAAVAMMMATAGCQKMNDIQTEDHSMKVEFTVADKPSFGADTKAVKTSWAVGDKIAIALKPSSSENVLYETKPMGKNSHIYSSHAIILELTESGWKAESKITPPEGNGTYYAIHHRGTISSTVTNNPAAQFNLTGYQGGELMSFTGPYSASNNGIINLGTISMALDSRLMQVSTAERLNGKENTDNDEFIATLYAADGGYEIDNPEKTVKMSIYKNWTGGNTSETMNNWVALSNGSVSVDFSASKLFVYCSDDKYKKGATPVLNYYNDESNCDYAFCFAYNGGESDDDISSYTFYIERTPEEGDEYTISYDELYLTIGKSDTRTLAKGKAIKLSDKGWTAVMN